MDEEKIGVAWVCFRPSIYYICNRGPIRSGRKLKGKKTAAKHSRSQGLLAELGVKTATANTQIKCQVDKNSVLRLRVRLWKPTTRPQRMADCQSGPRTWSKKIAQLIQREVKSKHKSAIMVTHDHSVMNM